MFFLRITFALGLGLLIGCQRRGEPDVTNATSPAVTEADVSPADVSPAAASPAAAEASEIALEVLDRAGFEQFLAKHRGKIVLVDFWATWCVPCMEGFPHTVELSRKYGGQDLVVASVALESPDDREKVLRFLTRQEATFPNFISAYGGADGRAMDEFEINSGTIPTLRLYDRSGAAKQTFGDGLAFTFRRDRSRDPRAAAALRRSRESRPECQLGCGPRGSQVGDRRACPS